MHCVAMRVYPDADQGAVLEKAAWPVLIVFEEGGGGVVIPFILDVRLVDVPAGVT